MRSGEYRDRQMVPGLLGDKESAMTFMDFCVLAIAVILGLILLVGINVTGFTA